MILIEHGPQGQPCLFETPHEVIIAHQMAQVRPALARAEALRAQGYWIAGVISYEAGFAFEPRLQGLARRQSGALLRLAAYEAPKDASALLQQAAQEGASLSEPMALVDRHAYDHSIDRVLDYIRAGDCYQVNLTFPMQAKLLSGSALGLYGALRAAGPVGHGGFVDLPQGPVLISRSPELFFKLSSGRLEARPMKGTRPRGATVAQDAALAADLASAPKDRAENLMIVDLLRNDISRLAKVGSVKVPQLFAVESYATVHQMVSTVVADLAAPPDLVTLIEALFPCGSITGAPKIRAMQIIHELEPYDRGAYCGAIGWMSPQGDADFSVAIRTLSLTKCQAGADVIFNVGGGIVQDSTAKGEWEEALWKARFVTSLGKRASI